MATDNLDFVNNGTQFDLVLTVSGTDGTGTVTAISGTVGSDAITSLSGYLGADNDIVSVDYPYLDEGGVSFDIAGDEYNLYGLSGLLQIVDNAATTGFGSTSDVTFSVTCYFPGTDIRTPGGDVAVETLRIGDLVVTADGRTQPVRWIGRKTVAMAFADPVRVLPIRIRAGALAEHQPARDLLVSPEHAILVDGLLVQAGALVNGLSILRERRVPTTFTYYHVELAEHALLLAEGTPAESFVDTVHRAGFDNWQEHGALYGAAPILPLPHPRAQSPRQVPAATRQRLMARAAAVAAVAA